MAEPKDQRIGLLARLSKVLGEIGNVPKNCFNDHFKYNHVMESALADHIRPLLAKHGFGLMFDFIDATDFQVVTDRGRTLNMTRVKDAITLGIEDSEGNIIAERTGHTFGQAADTRDKGLYKAMTAGVKYWALGPIV